jgi:hypothetical protein
MHENKSGLDINMLSIIGLKVQKNDLSAFLFKKLPWRPLRSVHYDAVQGIIESRKIRA